MATRTITQVTSSPGSSVFGQPVTFTATVSPVGPGGTPTGTVTFVVSGSGGGTFTVPLGPGGSASVARPSLGTGPHSVTASYNGSAQFAPSSGTHVHGVVRASTTTEVTATPASPAPGQAVTLTAKVTAVPPGGGTPRGTVVFIVGSLGQFRVQLDSRGTASVTVGPLTTGTHSVTAVYVGDADFLPSDGDTTVVVAPSRRPTTTVVVSSPDPSVFGTPVTLTATVTPASPGPGVPSGTVTFTVGGRGGGVFTAVLDANGTASVTVATLGAGSHPVTAAYGGDASFTASTGTDTHTVTRAPTTVTASSSPDPSVFGQTVTFTAVVTSDSPGGGVPTGTVRFVAGGGFQLVAQLDEFGVATISTDDLRPREFDFTAFYDGDDDHLPSQAPDHHVVERAPTLTGVTAAPEPSVHGQAVTFTATVAADVPGAQLPAPTGTVTFVVAGGGSGGGGTYSAVLDAQGVARVTVSDLGAGEYTVTAEYEGDDDFAPSSGTGTHTVERSQTATSVTASPDPSAYGQPVTLSATVTAVAPGAGTPGGTVAFTVGDGPTVTAPLDEDGTATVTESQLPPGQYTVTAAYQGDADFAPSTGTTTLTVGQAATATVVTASPEPSVYGQETSFTAVVAPAVPGAGDTPTGSVTFDFGGGETRTATLDATGTAVVSLGTLHAGTVSVTAAYSGDGRYLPSAGSGQHAVLPAPTATALAVAPGSSVTGEPVTFTATVATAAPGAGVPTGTVTFAVDGTQIAAVPLDAAGVASFTSGDLSPGPHTVTAVYEGTGDFASSEAAGTAFVGPAATSTSVASSPDPSTYGEEAVLTATVTPVAPAAGVPSGDVVFTVDGEVTLTAPLDAAGVASATTSALPPGGHTVVATYSAATDPRFTASTGTDTHTVTPAATLTSVSSAPVPSVFGQPVTLTATVTRAAPGAGVATGTVAFDVGGTVTAAPLGPDGTASLTLTSLPVGGHTVTASYSGDAFFAPSSGTAAHTVTAAATVVTLTDSPDPSKLGQAVLVRAVVASEGQSTGVPTGAVTFTVDGSGGGTFTVPVDANGTAELALAALALGSHTITADYGGSTGFAPASATAAHTVEAEPSTTTTVGSSPDPSVYGQPVTFTATTTPAGPGPVPTGTITFTVSGAGGGTFTEPLDAQGTATLTLDGLDVATHAVTAAYSGDGDHQPSTGADVHTVLAATTVTAVATGPDPTVRGQDVTFTADVSAVAPGAGTPTGAVVFTVDGGLLTLSAPLVDGTATAATGTLGAGSHTVVAVYDPLGDPRFGPSTGGDTHTVLPAGTSTTVTASPVPSVVGQAVRITATVAPVAPGAGTPTGTVTFDTGREFVTAAVARDGSASVTVGDLPAGDGTITAVYSGDSDFAPSEGTHTQTVGRAATFTTLVDVPDPSVFGEPVTLTATVAVLAPGAGSPTGTVTFTVDGVGGTVLTAPVGPDGTATVSTGALPAGQFPLSAEYSGDAGFAPSSAAGAHTVGRALTQSALSATSVSSVHGQPVTFTAVVSPLPPGAGTPTGTVTFTAGGEQHTAALDSGGVATVTTSTLPTGVHTVTADYAGDDAFAPSGAEGTHQVDAARTSTVLLIAPEPSLYGQGTTLTAAVAAAAPGAGIPTGTVTFTAGGEQHTAALDSGGVAAVTTGTLHAGTHAVTAAYGGSTAFAPSSASGTHRVEPSPTGTQVTSGPDPSVFGAPVVLAATVAAEAPGGGMPSGTVTFTVGGNQLALTAPLVDGTATVTVPALGVGDHTVEAVYGGSADHAPSAGEDTHTVVPAQTTTTVDGVPDPSAYGQPATFTATVSTDAEGAGVPSGSVTFIVDGGQQAVVPLDMTGRATLTHAYLPAGSHTVTAEYGGGSGFAPSTGTDGHTVVPAATMTVASSSPDPSVLGQAVTVRATVSSEASSMGVPTGTVVFTVGGVGGGTFSEPVNAGGTAELTLTGLSLGEHPVTAEYGGAADYAPSGGSTTQTVEVEPSTVTTVTSSPDPSVYGQPVTFTATTAPFGAGPVPTGTVTFTVSGGEGGGTFTEPLDAQGTATLTLDSLGVATHTVTAVYSGDFEYDPSSGADSQAVLPAATTTQLTTSPEPSVRGQSVTFTATVAAEAPGGGTPTGTVTFIVDGGQLALTAPLVDGTATAATDALLPGPHAVQAVYNATAGPEHTSSSADGTHTVEPAATRTELSASPDPSVYGRTVTFTAAVAAEAPGAGTPTGTVTFQAGTETVTVPVAPDGTATLAISTLDAGTRTVTATYNGDEGFMSSTGSTTHTVQAAPMSLAVSTTPEPSYPGQSALFTAVLMATLRPEDPAAGVPTGTVTFAVDGGPTLTASVDGAGVASVSLDSLPPGTYPVTATYGGDGNHAPATGSDVHRVEQGQTVTGLSSAPDPSVFGQPVTFTATVASAAPASGVPTGSVTFDLGLGAGVDVPLDASGTATCTTDALPAGTRLVSASYGGDTHFAPSTATAPHTVAPAATTTELTAAPSPSVQGQPVTLTATVTPTAPGAGTPTGTVTFTIDGGQLTLTTPLVGGTATTTTSTLTAGTHTIQATYNATTDPGYTDSTTTITHTVDPAATTVAVSTVPGAAVTGQPATLTAVVAAEAPGAGVPTGTVTFTVDGQPTTVALDPGGTASLPVTALGVGTHTPFVQYDGGGGFAPSAATATYTVGPASTLTALSASPEPSVAGEEVVLTAAVTPVPPGAGVPTGTVTFAISDGPVLTATLDSDGIARVATSALSLGVHAVNATYAGDGDFNPSAASVSHTVEVEPETRTTVVSDPETSVYGQPVTFTATTTPAGPGPVPTGTVTFTVSGGGGGVFIRPVDAQGSASLTLGSLDAGAHTVTAAYSGDIAYSPSSGSGSHTVTPSATVTTASASPDPAVYGQSVTLTATVASVTPDGGTPAGTVTFTVDGGQLALTAPLVGGTATVTTGALTAGAHTVQAAYDATTDRNHTASAGAATVTVEPVATTLTVSGTPQPVRVGQALVLRALVATAVPTGQPVTGSVTFQVDGQFAGTVPVTADRSATLTVNGLGAGDHPVTAAYSGDPNHQPSTAATTAGVVRAATATVATSTPDPSVFGQLVTFRAAVTSQSPDAPTPTGSVTFTLSGGATLTASLDAAGVATASTNALATGTYSVTAVYSGDAAHTTSTGTDTHRVDPSPTTTAVTGAPDPSVFGAAATFTAVVAPAQPGAGTPTGTVTFTIDGGLTLTVPLTGGSATVTRSDLGVGLHTVTARYNGDGSFAASTGADTHSVTGAPTTTVVSSSPNPSRPGRIITITAQVTAAPPGSGTPTGTVTFVVSGSGGGTYTAALSGGVATVTEHGLNIGPHDITATYTGDALFAGSTGTSVHTVIP